MKVAKWIDILSMEIEVHISGEEAVQAITEEAEFSGYSMEPRVKTVINNLAAFFKKVPSETIAALTPATREIVATFLREQAERFVPLPKVDGGALFDAAVDRVIARVDKGLEGKS